MAVNTLRIPRTPDVVFGVLSDPTSFERWVVGAADIRDAAPEWPAPGSSFQHTQGISFVGLKDSTTVVDADPPRRLVLEVRARPVVIAKVRLDLAEDDGGTHVTMTEWPIGGWLERIYRPRLDALIRMRNDISLRRLGEMAEERS